LPGNLFIQIEFFFKTRALLESLAGSVLIGPEGGIADQGLQFVELALLPVRVKGTSARRRLEISVVRIVQSVLRPFFLLLLSVGPTVRPTSGTPLRGLLERAIGRSPDAVT